MFGLQSPEVKASLEALRAVEEKHREMGSLVSRKVRDMIKKDGRKTTASIREDRLPPEGLVWLLVTNVVDTELSYGHHHIYRGILGMQGKTLLRLWDIACERMTVLGVHDAADEAKEKAYIRRQIAEVG